MRVHVVVPARFDDPTNPSGGNIYDQRICTGLTNLGWDVRITPVAVPRPLTTPPTTRPATDTRPATTATDTRPATTATGTRPATTADGMRPATTADGTRPATAEAARADLSRALTAIPDGELVLIDGLIASPSADPLLSHAPRLRLAVLVHTPHAPTPTTTPAHQSERAVLTAAAAVIATSTWTRHQLETHYAIPPTRIHVAHPGTDLPKAPHPNATPPING
ncbi:MAG TPA: glycosyltransferase, partial [Streptosporangiaceae bacterium]